MQRTLSHVHKSYFSLTKPGIIAGNAITTSSGFMLASREGINSHLFLAVLIGLSFIVASGCVFNNYIDRESDQKMARTQNRALANGLIAPKNALLFATFLGLFGVSILGALTGFLTTILALLGFVIYVFGYSFSKYYSMHGTLIGSIAGAVPPVVGYCAAKGYFDFAALLLFIIVALWQMPHFFAIAIYRIEEYAAASIPVLPLIKGIYKTKIHMLCYVAAFTVATLMLRIFHYKGFWYMVTAAIIGSLWLLLSIKGFKTENNKLWARQMFLFSLVAITALSLIIALPVGR